MTTTQLYTALTPIAINISYYAKHRENILLIFESIKCKLIHSAYKLFMMNINKVYSLEYFMSALRNLDIQRST